MKRSFLILFLPFLLTSPLLSGGLEAAELVVPTDFANIQDAITAADTVAGDTVLVEPGTYGPFTLRTSVSIRGRETAQTFITGGSTGTAITANNVTGVSIKNFTFTQATTAISVTESDVIITNNVFSLGAAGTAISIQNTSAAAPQIVNNTFYQNNAAIASNVDLTIKNNIFFGNAIDISPNTLSTATITYNAFNATTPAAPDLSGVISNIRGVDPLFVNPSANDFHLKSGSPCIDTGDSAVTDFIDATRSDMGTYGGSTNQDSIPMQVSGVTAAASTTVSDAIDVDWTPNLSYTVIGYNVYYDTTSGAHGTKKVADTTRPYSITGLSSASAAPAAPVLSQPTPSNQTLELTWTAVSGATGYTLHYGIATTAENAIDVGNVNTYTLQGLTNGQPYKIAVKAYAQAVYYFSVTAYDSATSTPGESHESSYASEVPVTVGAALSSGLSNEVSDFPEAVTANPNLPDKGCFIATAAYGYYSAPQVQALRKFRDAYLLTNAPGRAFVRWYYRYGPAAARFIDERPLLKPAIRAALFPAVAGALFMTGAPEPTRTILASSLICGIGWFLQGRTLRRRGTRR